MFFCIRQTCFSVFFLGALTPATFYITQRNKTLQQTKWWARVGSHHYRRFFRPLSRLLDDEPKLKCTSTGLEPARLTATFLQDLVWNSTIRVIAYSTRHSCRYASTYSATSALKFWLNYKDMVGVARVALAL